MKEYKVQTVFILIPLKEYWVFFFFFWSLDPFIFAFQVQFGTIFHIENVKKRDGESS